MTHAYNCDLQTLDVLLYRGRGPVAWAIRLFTASPYTHAAFAFFDHGRNLVCDATAGGIDVRPLSSDLLTGSRIAVRRIPGPPSIKPQMLDHVHLKVWQAWGVYRYGFGKLLLNAFSEIVGPWGGDPDGIPRRAMCSEWVSCFLRHYADYDPCPDFSDRFTTPADLARTPCLETVCDDLRIERSL